MISISNLYGREIYDTKGAFLGNVEDVILNLEDGKVIRLTTEPIRTTQALEHFIKKNSILYKRVKSAKDIVIIER